MVITLLATLVFAITLFSLLDSTSFFSSGNNKIIRKPKTIKEYTKQYFDDFQMFLCIPHKILLYPPRELIVRGVTYAMNTQTKSDLLPYKRMIMKKSTINRTRRCSECIRQCTFASGDFVDLHLSFNEFKVMNNDEVLRHLRRNLTQEQFILVFGSKYSY